MDGAGTLLSPTADASSVVNSSSANLARGTGDGDKIVPAPSYVPFGGISDRILKQAHERYGVDVKREDLFFDSGWRAAVSIQVGILFGPATTATSAIGKPPDLINV